VNEVEIRGLNQRFRSHQVLSDVSLSLRRGEVYGLLGPNGAGKSTLMKILLGMQRPPSGEITVFGEPFTRDALARFGGLIELPGLWEHLTGEQHMRIHSRLRGVPASRGEEELARFGLLDARKRKVKRYSLGMRWRLAIGIAMLHRPRVLVLDEPTNGLDPAGIRQMRTLIRELPAEGTTVFVSSHNLPEIHQMCDRVGVLVDGRLIYEGGVEGIGYQGDLEEGFLRMIESAQRA
jgi:ABC-2 type transport system ATP-binding protein